MLDTELIYLNLAFSLILDCDKEVFTESVFAIPGIGRLATEAIQNRDMPLLQGTVLFTAFVITLGNIIADLISFCLDPRLRTNR